VVGEKAFFYGVSEKDRPPNEHDKQVIDRQWRLFYLVLTSRTKSMHRKQDLFCDGTQIMAGDVFLVPDMTNCLPPQSDSRNRTAK